MDEKIARKGGGAEGNGWWVVGARGVGDAVGVGRGKGDEPDKDINFSLLALLRRSSTRIMALTTF